MGARLSFRCRLAFVFLAAFLPVGAAARLSSAVVVSAECRSGFTAKRLTVPGELGT